MHCICKMSEDKSLLIKTPFDDEFEDMFNGKFTSHGRDDRWIKKRIYQLERVRRNAEQQQELEDKRVELGFTRTGTKKPKVCWEFVHDGHCVHGWTAKEDGDVCGGRWHPGKKEAAYLKQKTCAE